MPNLRSTSDGNFLGMRVKIDRRIGAYLQTGMPAFTGNLGTLAGVYRTPAIACRRHRRVHPYQSGAALSRQRPAGGGLYDRAHGRSRRRPTRHRSGRIAPAQHHSAASAMPFKTGITFTYDCGEFEKNLDMALAARRQEGIRAAARRSARKHGKLRGLGFSNTIERAGGGRLSRAPRSGSTAPAPCRSSPAASPRARATKPYSSRSCATASGSTPNEVTICRATPIRCFSPKAPAARAPRRSPARRSLSPRKGEAKGKAIAAYMLKIDLADSQIRRWRVLGPEDQPDADHQGGGQASLRCRTKLPPGMEPGLIETAIYTRQGGRTTRTASMSANSKSTGDRRSRDRALHVVDDVGTVINPLLLTARSTAASRKGVGQILMEDISSTPTAATCHRLVHGLRHAAGERPHAPSAIKSNPVPTKTNPLGVKGAGEAGCVGAMPAVANALVDALSEFGRHATSPCRRPPK